MKEDVRGEPQQPEASSFMRKKHVPVGVDLVMENIRKPHADEHISNLANLLTACEN